MTAQETYLANKLPPKPGTAPIPSGHIRLYHQTDVKNFPSILAHGLRYANARGIEGPKGIWADPEGFYGKPKDVPTIEFHVPEEQWNRAGRVMQDVPPENIIAAHRPWHSQARYLLENPDSLQNLLDDLKTSDAKQYWAEKWPELLQWIQDKSYMTESKRILFRDILKETFVLDDPSKYLYHGTLRKNEESIMQSGLIAQIGEFTRDAYSADESELEAMEEYVFASGFEDMQGAISAMGVQIAHMLHKDFDELTQQDIATYGLLLVLDMEDFKHRPEEDDGTDYTEYPLNVETGDYYSSRSVYPLTALNGQELVNFLLKYKADEMPKSFTKTARVPA